MAHPVSVFRLWCLSISATSGNLPVLFTWRCRWRGEWLSYWSTWLFASVATLVFELTVSPDTEYFVLSLMSFADLITEHVR